MKFKNGDRVMCKETGLTGTLLDHRASLPEWPIISWDNGRWTSAYYRSLVKLSPIEELGLSADESRSGDQMASERRVF